MESRSPLFPDAALTLASDLLGDALIPQLPSEPTILTSSLQVYIVPAEKHLFVQGFKRVEYESRPPTLLRGSLVVRVLKPNKIRSITLTFRGTCKTDWPEGIPPKRSAYQEINDLVNHSWPFYQVESLLPNGGADIYVPASLHDDISHLSLEPVVSATHLAPTAGLFAANLIKKATLPLLSATNLTPVSSFPDLTTVLSSLSLSTTDAKPGAFPPGDYVYNFEHPLPALSPESVHATFGNVSYYLEALIQRQTTFKSNLCGRIPVTVVRIPSDNSVEENEPIVIERDWEDQLRYEIVVASKSVVLDSYLPISLKFIPLYGKVALHRIRIYISEDSNYYCSGKNVHRKEPTRKYLLLEHKAHKKLSLLAKNGGLTDEVDPENEVLPRELEFQMFIPSLVTKNYEICIHPDTAVEHIECNHWIKISLRISKPDPNNPEKRKHFEILIDSPIHLYSPLAAHNNTLLPVYSTAPEFLPQYTQNPLALPDVTAVDASNPQHLLWSVFCGEQSKSNDPMLRSVSPLTFRHISSPKNNDGPLEREENMHLNSNLYKPENDEVLSTIGSPQATAFSPVASPLQSPVRSPTRLQLSEPSMEPPSFNEAGIQQDTLPPAYVPDARFSPQIFQSEDSQFSLSIKNKLNKQLEKRGRRGGSDKESLASERSSLLAKTLEKRGLEDNHSADLRQRSDLSLKLAKVPVKDIQKPEEVPEVKDQSLAVPSTDITDLEVPIGHTSMSRHSSVSLNGHVCEDEPPTELTLPLLSPSSTSVNDPRYLMESNRYRDFNDSMSDLISSSLASDDGVQKYLPQIRNPRLTKHYQEPSDEDYIEMIVPKGRQKSFGVVPEMRMTGDSDTDKDTLDGREMTKRRHNYVDMPDVFPMTTE